MKRPSPRAIVAGVAVVALTSAPLVALAQVAPDEPEVEACLQSSVICSGLDIPGDETSDDGPIAEEDLQGETEGEYEPPTCTAWDGTEGPQTYELVGEPDQSDWKMESPRFEEDGVTPQEGNWYRVFCGGSPRTNEWIPSSSGPEPSSAPSTPAPPSGAEVRNQTPIPEPDIQIDPNLLGLTGLLTTFTTSAAEPISSTSSIRGYTVTATATPTYYEWDFGDDNGYGAGRQAEHTYETRSDYVVTLTVTYSGSYTWSGNGRSGSGDLGTIERSVSRDYKVIEARGVLGAVS